MSLLTRPVHPLVFLLEAQGPSGTCDESKEEEEDTTLEKPARVKHHSGTNKSGAMRVPGFRCREDCSSGFRVSGFGFRVQVGFGCRVPGLGCRVDSGSRLMLAGSEGNRVQGFGLSVEWGLRVEG